MKAVETFWERQKEKCGDKPILVTYGLFVHSTRLHACFGTFPLEPIKIRNHYDF